MAYSAHRGETIIASRSMSYALAVLQLIVVGYLSYLLWFLIVGYHPADPLGFDPPLVIWMMDLINLYIHEAGHLLSRVFGMGIGILGGSLLQLLLPLALVIVTLRESSRGMPYAMFWAGESFVNVAVYVADARYKNLRLIREGLVHDWNWLLRDRLSWAEPISTTLRVIGLLLCLTAIILLAISIMRRIPSRTRDASAHADI